MVSKKCQPRPSKKIHDPVTMDMFKTTCPKSLKGFFYASPKWAIFYQNLLSNKLGILILTLLSR
jgi:hypothetical protein